MTTATRKQRISYVPYEDVSPDMQEELRRCAREGTPRPESSSVRAHVPAAFWFFANSWRDLFHGGVCDHGIKDLCRVYVSRSVKCEYCGNQRSEKARDSGIEEAKYDDLLNFERSERYDAREKAALAYTEAIAWRLPSTDELWERLDGHFSEAELVELGCFVGLTLGQQSWLRLLDIEHHEILSGGTASMAPGFETAESLADSKASETYWAKGGSAVVDSAPVGSAS
ncbi:MAG: carboxymuconolactone decarboxylase family protein [Acidimicrobiales bacterium]